MGEIYSRAQRVMIWLAELANYTVACMRLMIDDTCTSEEEIDLIEKGTFAPGPWIPRRLTQHNCGLEQSFTPQDDWLKQLLPESPVYADLYNLLLELFRSIAQLSYFRRGWILQEIALARHRQVVLGDCSMSWGQFCRYLNQIRAMDRAYRDVITEFMGDNDPLCQLIETISATRGWEPMPLGALIFTYARSRQCKDPRDSVYSLLSLADGTCDVKPDYTCSSTRLFLEVLQNILHNGGWGGCHGHDLVRLLGIHGVTGGYDQLQPKQRNEYLVLDATADQILDGKVNDNMLYICDGHKWRLPCKMLFTTWSEVRGCEKLVCVMVVHAGYDSQDWDRSSFEYSAIMEWDRRLAITHHVKVRYHKESSLAKPRLEIGLSAWLLARILYRKWKLNDCLVQPNNQRICQAGALDKRRATFLGVMVETEEDALAEREDDQVLRKLPFVGDDLASTRIRNIDCSLDPRQQEFGQMLKSFQLPRLGPARADSSDASSSSGSNVGIDDERLPQVSGVLAVRKRIPGMKPQNIKYSGTSGVYMPVRSRFPGPDPCRRDWQRLHQEGAQK